MGRAFRELGIEWIPAHSPQAKGRIERCFGTLQDRLVKGLRQAGAKNIVQANQYLEEEFLPEWNRRFTVEAASAVDAHRPLGEALALESILSHVEQRRVMNDYTIAWQGQQWQIPKEAVAPGLRGSSIRMEARLDGTVMARIGCSFVALSICIQAARIVARPARQARRYIPPPGKSRWMDHFSLKGNENWKAYRQGAAAVSASPPSPSGLSRRD